MFARLRTLVTAAMVGCVLVAGAASASAQVHRVEPTPLAASDPLAQRAAGIVKALIAGNKPEAIKKLKEESDESFVKSKDFEASVDKQIARLTKATYTIRDFETGLGADVVVHLQTASGEDANIVIRFNDAKRVVGFAQVQISGGN